jgi:hypothetical protein
MGLEMIPRVTILAVGIERYQNLPRLSGPVKDIENLHSLLISTPATGLFQERQFRRIQDPSSDDLRSIINSYVLARSARGDILVFYFSGHGIPIGTADFGFCTTDTIFHPAANSVLPLSLLKFSDLLSSISVLGIVPVIIIDACYSGRAGTVLVSAQDAITAMHDGINSASATNYALLCSCSGLQSSAESPQGGVFSLGLSQVLSSGLPDLKDSYSMSLRDVFHPLEELTAAMAHDAEPRLYIGQTFTDFPIAKNVQFSPQSYSFVGHLRCVIQALWNDADERELSPGDIHEICGPGAYGNHQKLSLAPWNLVENVEGSKNRRLTDRGRLFARGLLSIPRSIQKDPVSESWIGSPGSVQIDINTADS